MGKKKVIDLKGKSVFVRIVGDYADVMNEFKKTENEFIKAGASLVYFHNDFIKLKFMSDEDLNKIGLQRIKNG